MAAQRTFRSPFADRRVLYVILGLGVLLPVAIFGIAGISSDSLALDGPGGPLLAFSAGVLSFVSPCVLPIVPIYITQLSGASVVNGRVTANRRVTFSHAVAFVTGLSAIFIFLGASAGLLGSFFLKDNQRELEQGAGLLSIFLGILLIPSHGARSPMRSAVVLLALTVVYFFIAEVADLRGDRRGLSELAVVMAFAWLRFAGYLPLNFFSRTFEVNVGRNHRAGYARSALIGGAFAVGWTPCVGPILGSILTMAGQSGDAGRGTFLLASYAFGFSVPFLITGLAMSEVTRFYRKITPFTPAIEVASGLMIIGVGLLLWYGHLTGLNDFFMFADFNGGL